MRCTLLLKGNCPNRQGSIPDRPGSTPAHLTKARSGVTVYCFFIRHSANECRVFARFSEQEMSISGNFEKSLVGVRLVVGRE
jgi:hypothetical protein